MNLTSSFIYQNIFGSIGLFLIIMFSYYFQKKSDSKSFIIAKNSSKNYSLIFNMILSSILSVVYILIGLFLEFHFSIASISIFEISFNLGFIIIITLLVGCFYSSIIISLGNIVAFFLVGKTAFLATFTLIRAAMPLFIYIFWLYFNKQNSRSKKNSKYLMLVVPFLVFLSTLIFSILLYQNKIVFLSNEAIQNIRIFWLSFIILSSIFILFFLFGIVLNVLNDKNIIEINKIFKFLKSNIFWFVFIVVSFVVILIDLLLDPLLIVYSPTYRGLFNYQELVLLSFPTVFVSIIFNLITVYWSLLLFNKQKKYNFLISKKKLI